MKQSVYILFNMVHTKVKGEKRGFIDLKSLSPEINQKLKFGYVGDEEHYSFDQLRERVEKIYYKRGDTLFLFVVNTETGEKQKFGIDLSKDWPEGIAGDKLFRAHASFEITSYLENIGIL